MLGRPNELCPQCPVCLELFQSHGHKAPCSLACGHSCCEQCISSLQQFADTRGWPCPLRCAEVNVSQPRPNYALRSQLPPLQEVTSLNPGDSTANRPTKCGVHTKPLSHVCVECDVRGCPDCIRRKCLSCCLRTAELIVDGSAKQQRQLRDALDKLEVSDEAAVSTLAAVQAVLKELGTGATDESIFVSTVAAAKRQVQEHFAMLHARIAAREAHLIEQVDALREGKVKRLHNQREFLSNYRTAARQITNTLCTSLLLLCQVWQQCSDCRLTLFLK